MIMLFGILCFSLAAFLVSLAVGKRSRTADRSELSATVLIVAWGALLVGLSLGRL